MKRKKIKLEAFVPIVPTTDYRLGGVNKKKTLKATAYFS